MGRKIVTDLERAEETARKGRGWCHLSDEVALLAREILLLKAEVARLKKKTKKVVDDE